MVINVKTQSAIRKLQSRQIPGIEVRSKLEEVGILKS